MATLHTYTRVTLIETIFLTSLYSATSTLFSFSISASHFEYFKIYSIFAHCKILFCFRWTSGSNATRQCKIMSRFFSNNIFYVINFILYFLLRSLTIWHLVKLIDIKVILIIRNRLFTLILYIYAFMIILC